MGVIVTQYAVKWLHGPMVGTCKIKLIELTLLKPPHIGFTVNNLIKQFFYESETCVWFSNMCYNLFYFIIRQIPDNI